MEPAGKGTGAVPRTWASHVASWPWLLSVCMCFVHECFGALFGVDTVCVDIYL